MPDLPGNVVRALDDFTTTAKAVFGADLQSMVLYGSAAEGRLRSTSNVNIILILSTFNNQKTTAIREALRIAHATVKLDAMFILRSEIAAGAEAFPDKWADVVRRHQVLFGDDPFAQVSVPHAAKIARLEQILLNFILQLRETFVL